MQTKTIYVELLDEGVEVWAPVEATAEGTDVYRLPAASPADQRWALPPGALVRCETRGNRVVAVAIAE